MSQLTDNKRLAKNTLLLYLRMFVMMGISVFTSRVILGTLGVSDYGVYNVVAGAIMMVGFIKSSFASASSRFITISIGKGDSDEMKLTFGGIMAIQCLLAFFIVILAETLGLWFVKTQLVIPEGRLFAALVVYQFSVISCIVNIVKIPYNAEIIAHEKMSAFAYISILDAILKLLVVYSLFITPYDKLIIYGLLLLLVDIIDFTIWYFYCINKFNETRGRIKVNRALSKEVMKYTSWTLTGAVTNMTCNQGINFLLNIFFGPVVNAARGIAFQVQMVIQNFATNFQTALNPQIVKCYANSDYGRISQLVSLGTKFSFYLLLLISMPVILKIDFLLSIWLVEVPQYTSSFIILLLMINLIHSAFANPLIFAINATGDIKVFQIAEGICLILIIPISYLLYKLFNFSPNLIFIVYLIIEGITQIVRSIIVLPRVKIDALQYIRKVVIPIVVVFIIVIAATFFLKNFSDDTWTNFVLLTVIEVLIILGVIFLFGLSNYEKQFVLSKIKSRI